MTALTPLRRRSVVDEAYEALRGQILHRVWVPGDKVPTEQALTEQLGVSRSTVREALNRLASAGLILSPHGGTKIVQDVRSTGGLEHLAAMVVRPDGQLDLSLVRDVTEMRGALAPDVARRAAARRTDEQASALVAASEVLQHHDDLTQLMELTLNWWTLLVLASDNLAYRLAYNTLRSTYTEGRSVLQGILAPELRADGYRGVSSAVQQGKPEEAARQCAELVALGNDALFHVLAAAKGA